MFAEALERNNSVALEGILVTEAVSLCFDGRNVVICVTNGIIGTLNIQLNTPVRSLRVVRPEFEVAVMNQQVDKEKGSTQSPMSSAPPASRALSGPGASRPRQTRRSPATAQLSQMTEGRPRLPLSNIEEGLPGLLPAGQMGRSDSDEEEPPGLLPDLSDTEGDTDNENEWNDVDSDGEGDDDNDDDGEGVMRQPHLMPYYLDEDKGEPWWTEASREPANSLSQETLSLQCSLCQSICQCVTEVSSEDEIYMSSED